MNTKASFRATMCNLSAIMAFVDGVVKKCNMREDKWLQLKLAVEEVIVNIVQYSYPCDYKGTIELECESNDAQFQLTVIDSGVPYNPLAQKTPNLEAQLDDREIGGLGVFLILNSVDDVNYQRLGKQNVLTIVKFIK
ncbi:ATP-binding protein [Pleionea sp. CnH1-48]|uniref:ATP-binding protein n=1 Tax=Pleionea sp. CnH1-48 TaxID=2954494 RepID=UPI002097E437|nr:ATP-binding protein [Pleionea sp. CnH1-48]MCO7227021.1 ATP-binding protein [Pleionea sp. CnH1-48]